MYDIARPVKYNKAKGIRGPKKKKTQPEQYEDELPIGERCRAVERARPPSAAGEEKKIKKKYPAKQQKARNNALLSIVMLSRKEKKKGDTCVYRYSYK